MSQPQSQPNEEANVSKQISDSKLAKNQRIKDIKSKKDSDPPDESFWSFCCGRRKAPKTDEIRGIPPLLRGLPNQYRNCYLNAAMQCLFASMGFMQVVSGSSDESQLAKDVLHLQTDRKEETIHSIGITVMPEFGAMQCAHAFFLNLVNMIKHEAERESAYNHLFQVEIEYRIVCTDGHEISKNVNSYLSLSLPIPAPLQMCDYSVYDCLEVLTWPKKIEYPCDTCGGNRAMHTARIARLSRILVIHFQRYIDGGKDDRVIDFPEVIDISGKHYEVYGVVYHNGTLKGGHYYAYVKYSGVWYEANDMKVKKVGVKKPPCEGAYMLFCNQIDRS